MPDHERLLAAYRATSYVVAGLELRIGVTAPELDGCIITAWNPRSALCSVEANHAAGARLAAAVAGFRTLPARAVPDDPAWPPEDGLFVFDIAPDEALGLAEAFGQNAIVQVTRGAAPVLLLTGLLKSPAAP